jgi:predicted transcriptional regulator
LHINLKLIEKNKHDYPDENVLNNDIRIRAFNEILQNPGIPLKELRSRLKINLGTFFLNLRVLERHGMIKVKKNKCYSSYFPLIEYQVRPTKNSITNHSMRRIFEFIKKTTGATRKEISEKIGLNEVAVHYQLKKLIEANLILKVKDGEQSRFFVLTC